MQGGATQGNRRGRGVAHRIVRVAWCAGPEAGLGGSAPTGPKDLQAKSTGLPAGPEGAEVPLRVANLALEEARRFEQR